ncbi:hypothetical protein [Lacticaseibacillus sharpeae]|uniref:hypothetical protein n=1 Tax=Lacticaseibacillus sharpeae TaxID=1626 RepID=UPI0034E23646
MAKDDINKTNIGDVGTDSSKTDAKNFDVSKLTPVATMTTGENDNANLPTKSTGVRGAVYLFRESVTPKATTLPPTSCSACHMLPAMVRTRQTCTFTLRMPLRTTTS